jgi:hypothetical protein
VAVTWTKTQVTHTNPFDGTTETVLEVGDVQIAHAGGAVEKCTSEHYTFADGTPDATIQADVESDLTAKGYVIA